MSCTEISSVGRCARVSLNGAEIGGADASFSNTLTDRLSAMACANAYAARSETAPAAPATGCARSGSGQRATGAADRRPFSTQTATVRGWVSV